MTATPRATKPVTACAESSAAPVREPPAAESSMRLHVGRRILLCGIAGAMMSLQARAAEPQAAHPPQTDTSASASRTGKERLGGKETDEQRVDNCKVPPEKWGPKTRPASCDHGSSPVPTR